VLSCASAMRHSRSVIPLLAAASALAGCIHTGFVRTSPIRTRPRPANCYLDIILDGTTPPFPYVTIGRVSTDGTAPGVFALVETEDEALDRMREEACLAGGHFLMSSQTGSQGQWTPDGFSRSTRGTAVVGIYVQPDGTPLPPPRGPTLRVHMPGSGSGRPTAVPSSRNRGSEPRRPQRPSDHDFAPVVF
jgi:hypothetical protein